MDREREKMRAVDSNSVSGHKADVFFCGMRLCHWYCDRGRQRERRERQISREKERQREKGEREREREFLTPGTAKPRLNVQGSQPWCHRESERVERRETNWLSGDFSAKIIYLFLCWIHHHRYIQAELHSQPAGSCVHCSWMISPRLDDCCSCCVVQA